MIKLYHEFHRVYLVGGLEHLYFSIYWESSSQLTFIFFRGVGQPPTRYYTSIKHDGWGTYQPLSTIVSVSC